MATKIWEGKVEPIAQVRKANVTGFDAATQYQIVIGGVIVAYTSGNANHAATAVALSDAFNASTHPYARAITAAVTGSTNVQLTADIAGNPFTATYNVTGGTGGFAAATDPQANVSPNDWDDDDNWEDGSKPASADDVIFRDSSIDVLWGLDQAAVDLASLVIEQSYTGKIGLSRTAFVTGEDGAQSYDAPEYRDDYLDIGWDVCRIGENLGPGNPNGSGRLKLDNDKAGASETTIFDTASAATDADMPAVRLLLANASANLQIRNAPGGVGIAIDKPGETSTMGDIDLADDTPASRLFIGEGVTWANLSQQGGVNQVRAAAGVTSITVLGGELDIEGDQAVTTLNVHGGTVRPNNVPSAGSAVTTINLYNGTVDGTASREARTWGTVNLKAEGATLVQDPDVITVSTVNLPTDSGAWTVTID